MPTIRHFCFLVTDSNTELFKLYETCKISLKEYKTCETNSFNYIGGLVKLELEMVNVCVSILLLNMDNIYICRKGYKHQLKLFELARKHPNVEIHYASEDMVNILRKKYASLLETDNLTC